MHAAAVDILWYTAFDGLSHRLSFNRPIKRGKDKSPSDEHCQCEKKMDNLYWHVNKFLKKSHVVTSKRQFETPKAMRILNIRHVIPK
jgi:hypothetical protein